MKIDSNSANRDRHEWSTCTCTTSYHWAFRLSRTVISQIFGLLLFRLLSVFHTKKFQYTEQTPTHIIQYCFSLPKFSVHLTCLDFIDRCVQPRDPSMSSPFPKVLALFFALLGLFGKARFFRPLLRFLVNIALFSFFS